jgi:hypothetical protein
MTLTFHAREPVLKRVRYADREAREPEWKKLHRAADGMVPAFRRTFLEAVAWISGQARGEAVLRTSQRGMRASRPFLGSFLGGRVILKQDVGMEWRLDLRSAEMIGAASSQAATLVREVSTETMLAIRKIIVDAQEQGLSIPQQARRIRDMGLGLTQRQATAVLNFERMLVEQGLSPDVVARRTERYYKRAIKRRATLIARTETMHAANMGQQEMWRQAWKDGLLSPQTRRVWIVSLGRKYGPNSGGGTMLEEQFVSDPIQRQNGSFRGIEPSLTPPAHPGCRCAMALKTIEPACTAWADKAEAESQAEATPRTEA